MGSEVHFPFKYSLNIVNVAKRPTLLKGSFGRYKHEKVKP